jgi:hypothetical protein
VWTRIELDKVICHEVDQLDLGDGSSHITVLSVRPNT